MSIVYILVVSAIAALLIVAIVAFLWWCATHDRYYRARAEATDESSLPVQSASEPKQGKIRGPLT